MEIVDMGVTSESAGGHQGGVPSRGGGGVVGEALEVRKHDLRLCLYG
jgi:hypothetical protein